MRTLDVSSHWRFYGEENRTNRKRAMSGTLFPIEFLEKYFSNSMSNSQNLKHITVT